MKAMLATSWGVRTGRSELEGAIKAAAAAIESADALVITAGAGIGVDSGLPDYRGDQGLWRAYPRLKQLGLSFESMATPVWFERNPRMAWAFYGHRRQLYRETSPHRGYSLLRSWGEATPCGYFAYTSNVDGHFQRAGYRADRLVECHGNVHFAQCCEPCHGDVWQDVVHDFDLDLDEHQARDPLPTCSECSKVSRPNVLMFDDWDWIPDATAVQMARYKAWVEELRTRGARVAIIEVGAGTRLDTIRRESEMLAEELTADLIRINTRESEGPEGTISIKLPGLEALERIDTGLPNVIKEACQPDNQSGRLALDCPFCRVPPVKIIAASELVLALHDGFPVSPGHALVVPRRHVASWSDLSPAERVAIWQAVDEVRDLLTDSYRPSAFNVGFNDGAAAGQTVMHFHAHVIPRYAGDTVDPRGGIRWVLPEKAAYWGPKDDG